MLLGPAACGKTTVVEVLAGALSAMDAQDRGVGPVSVKYVFPKVRGKRCRLSGLLGTSATTDSPTARACERPAHGSAEPAAPAPPPLLPARSPPRPHRRHCCLREARRARTAATVACAGRVHQPAVRAVQQRHADVGGRRAHGGAAGLQPARGHQPRLGGARTPPALPPLPLPLAHQACSLLPRTPRLLSSPRFSLAGSARRVAGGGPWRLFHVAAWLVLQVLDGPVDHIWVEALNPVLDDNRTLCLSSGETIPLRQGVNLIMEVRAHAGVTSLAERVRSFAQPWGLRWAGCWLATPRGKKDSRCVGVVWRACAQVDSIAMASPATISRCGMVYLGAPSSELWGHQIHAWCKHKLPPVLQEYVDKVETTVTLVSAFGHVKRALSRLSSRESRERAAW